MTEGAKSKTLSPTWGDLAISAVFGGVVAAVIRLAFPNITELGFAISFGSALAIFFYAYFRFKNAKIRKDLDTTNV